MSSFAPPFRCRSAATAAQVFALLWLAVGMQILHPYYHHHYESACGHEHEALGTAALAADAGGAEAPALTGLCPVCSLAAAGGTVGVSPQGTVLPPGERPGGVGISPVSSASAGALVSHQARAPPFVS